MKGCAAFSPENMLLILGSARSGTTWLAAIFDSHEDVLYRHEPDTIVRRGSIPGPCPREAIPLFRSDARTYLHELAQLSRSKTIGRPLLFRKRHRSVFDSMVRLGRYCMLRALERGTRRADAGAVGDRLRRGSKVRVLIKSISGCGRAGLYAAALPDAQVIFIVRNPFGQIASMLRGTKLGRLDGIAATDGLWEWPEAVAYGLTRDDFETMTLVERLTWHWALHTQKALEDLDGRTNVRTVCYEALCARPQETVDGLFAFARLPMTGQTRRFVARSSKGHHDRAYFSVFKNAATTATRWQSDLSETEEAAIAAIVAKTNAYALYRSVAARDGFPIADCRHRHPETSFDLGECRSCRIKIRSSA